jgi:hypothetical protein
VTAIAAAVPAVAQAVQAATVMRKTGYEGNRVWADERLGVLAQLVSAWWLRERMHVGVIAHFSLSGLIIIGLGGPCFGWYHTHSSSL